MYRLFRQVHPSLTLAILLTAGLLFPITSHADEGCSWEGIKFTFNPSKKMYLSTLLEHRTNDNFQRTDCYFGRQYVGWKWTPWLKTDAAYEIQKDQESVYHRGMFSATATLKEGNFALSLRERYLYDYSVDRKDGDQVLRTKLTAQYHIPDTKISPYIATEVFVWEKWKKTRHCAGIHYDINDKNSLEFFYIYYTKAGTSPTQHVVGVYYNINL